MLFQLAYSHCTIPHLGDWRIGNKHWLDPTWLKHAYHDRACNRNVVLGRCVLKVQLDEIL